jgi:hypothetical protein
VIFLGVEPPSLLVTAGQLQGDQVVTTFFVGDTKRPVSAGGLSPIFFGDRKRICSCEIRHHPVTNLYRASPRPDPFSLVF